MIYTHDTDAPLTKEQWDYNFQQLSLRYTLATGKPMPVILRQNLSRPLTNREADSNVQNLDAALRRLEYGDGPYPVLDQTFVGASFLDPRITHTRPGKSWRIVNGVLREYDVNEPVLTPEGWSVRPAETNLLWPSADFTDSRWTKANVSLVGGYSAPDGSSAATKLVSSGVGTYSFVANNAALGAGTYCFKCFVAANNAPIIYFRVFGTDIGGSGLTDMFYSLSFATGVMARVSGGTAISATAMPMANGWFEVNIVFTASAVTQAGIYRALGTAQPTWEPIAFAAQINEGNPIPYIPTTSAAVTRPADNALIQGAAFSEVLNPAEGAVVLRYQTELGQDNSRTAFQIRGAPGSNTDALYAFVRPNGGLGLIWYVDSIQTTNLTPAATFAEAGTIAWAWDASGMQVFARGSKEGALITPDKYRVSGWALFALGYSGVGGNPNSKSTYSRLRIFNRRPSDAQMQEWTT